MIDTLEPLYGIRLDILSPGVPWMTSHDDTPTLLPHRRFSNRVRTDEGPKSTTLTFLDGNRHEGSKTQSDVHCKYVSWVLV